MIMNFPTDIPIPLNHLHIPVVTTTPNARQQLQGAPDQVFYIRQQQQQTFTPQGGGLLSHGANWAGVGHCDPGYGYTANSQEAIAFSQVSVYYAHFNLTYAFCRIRL